MAAASSRSRVVAILWFVAAGPAFIAAATAFLKDGDRNLTALAGGIFCLVMGIVSSQRAEAPPERPTR